MVPGWQRHLPREEPPHPHLAASREDPQGGGCRLLTGRESSNSPALGVSGWGWELPTRSHCCCPMAARASWRKRGRERPPAQAAPWRGWGAGGAHPAGQTLPPAPPTGADTGGGLALQAQVRGGSQVGRSLLRSRPPPATPQPPPWPAGSRTAPSWAQHMGQERLRDTAWFPRVPDTSVAPPTATAHLGEGVSSRRVAGFSPSSQTHVGRAARTPGPSNTGRAPAGTRDPSGPDSAVNSLRWKPLCRPTKERAS